MRSTDNTQEHPYGKRNEVRPQIAACTIEKNVEEKGAGR